MCRDQKMQRWSMFLGTRKLDEVGRQVAIGVLIVCMLAEQLKHVGGEVQQLPRLLGKHVYHLFVAFLQV